MAWIWLIPFGIFATIGLLILKYANYIPILYHDSENRKLIAITRKRQVEIPVDKIFNVTSGSATTSYEGFAFALISGTANSVYTYYLTVDKQLSFGRSIRFRIEEGDTECMDNFFRLRGEIIRQRSQRAKSIVANRNSTGRILKK